MQEYAVQGGMSPEVIERLTPADPHLTAPSAVKPGNGSTATSAKCIRLTPLWDDVRSR